LANEEGNVDQAAGRVIRQKITGVLLRHARLTAGRSQAELAAALRVSRYRYAQYEQGQRDLSLPELELIADLCGVPLGFFFDDTAKVEDETGDTLRLTETRIRRKTVGVLLRQARRQADKTQRECAAALGVSPRRISQYESGEQAIPLAELEALASYLDLPQDHFAP
jgi:transcriptional regulator with XRE-family HTH domain